MSYEKHTWETGEVITAEKLNNMEQGIENTLQCPIAYMKVEHSDTQYGDNYTVIEASITPQEYRSMTVRPLMLCTIVDVDESEEFTNAKFLMMDSGGSPKFYDGSVTYSAGEYAGENTWYFYVE